MFMHALAEFKGMDEMISKSASQHKIWLKSLLIAIFEPSQQDIAQKAETIMTFLEGMIVRAEFSDVTGYEEIYRLGAKTLASTNLKTADYD